ncbi:carbonic anhydrase [Breoghania sp.]|uniref:carbonic anhydrase n=1 Tax=Breoghania sp. TaxID=2065378 RepID=UPI0026394B4B|nr:carbonic anhydrase [Breoghania sp.]MDJ0930435.1 carbonic anhydrase [Breoghania sp.]
MSDSEKSANSPSDGSDKTPPTGSNASGPAFPADLLSGYARYREGSFLPNQRALEDLAIYGQKPKVLVISCCDSRVTPESIFNVGPGELFVVRNVANLVPPYEEHGDYHGTSAALEFAVHGLKVEHIVVMGHAQCGGIAAFRSENSKPLSSGDFIGKWITLLQPAAVALACNPVEPGLDPQMAMEFAGVRQSLKNLRTFPWVKNLEENDRLALHGAWFDIWTGKLKVMQREDGVFVDV